MAELDTAKRDRLHDSVLRLHRQGAASATCRSTTTSHVRNAIARFDQTDFESATAKHARGAKQILAAARRHDIEVDRRRRRREGLEELAELARRGRSLG